MKFGRTYALSAVGVTLLSSAFLACSSSASNPIPVYGDDAGDAAHSTGPKSDAARDAAPDGTVLRDGTAPPSDAPVSNDAPLPTDGAPPADALIDVSVVDGHLVDAATCQTDGGCYKCTPTTNIEFLNQCTSSACTPFDNAQRLPNYDGGQLPPLN